MKDKDKHNEAAIRSIQVLLNDSLYGYIPTIHENKFYITRDMVKELLTKKIDRKKEKENDKNI